MGHQWQENIYILLFIKSGTNLEATSKYWSQITGKNSNLRKAFYLFFLKTPQQIITLEKPLFTFTKMSISLC